MSLIVQAYDWLPSRMMMVLSVVTAFHMQTQKTMNIAAAATAISPISRFRRCPTNPVSISFFRILALIRHLRRHSPGITEQVTAVIDYMLVSRRHSVVKVVLQHFFVWIIRSVISCIPLFLQKVDDLMQCFVFFTHVRRHCYSLLLLSFLSSWSKMHTNTPNSMSTQSIAITPNVMTMNTLEIFQQTSARLMISSPCRIV
nr:MAG TPA: hypothetical protein [Bacteriophage sp.]